MYISAAGNIATDLIIVILPLPMIRRLHLAPAQKAVLSFVFCLGLVYVVELLSTQKHKMHIAGKYLTNTRVMPPVPRPSACCDSSI